MSFFDEADEPRSPPRTVPRRQPSRSGRRPPTRGGRPPRDGQPIQVRRGVALVLLLIVIVLIVVGVHSCEVSQNVNSLKDYNDNVASLSQQSDQTGVKFFNLLSSGGQGNPTALQNEIDQARMSAADELSRAQSLSVPGQLQQAQNYFALALRMREDGIANIAQEIQPALNSSTAQNAVDSIAANMARFYASDALYKDYALPLIVGALNQAGIPVGGLNGQTLSSGQFLPSIQWLDPSYIAQQLHTTLPQSSGGGKFTPGLHGHSLNSVSVNGVTLNTGSTNTIPASPTPTFTLNITNGGHFTEHNVVCKVTVSATSVSGQTAIPQTTAGETTSCQVKLSSSPPKGSATVVATVEPVPGEKNTANNTLTFPVTFQ